MSVKTKAENIVGQNKNIDKLNDKAWSISRNHASEAIEIAESSLILAEEKNYKFGEARAYHILGASYGWLAEGRKEKKY